MSPRIWEHLLTEQDKAHIANSPVKTITYGASPAIINVDFYRAAFGDNDLPLLEGIKTWPGYCGPASWASIPHTQILLRAARAAGIPVFHFTNLTPEKCGVPNWWEAIYTYPEAAHEGPADGAARDRHARRFDIVSEVRPIPGEVVLYKTAPSVFFGTPLIAHLNHLRIDTLLIAGESTSGCVRASVIDAAASYRFRVKVIEECVFDRHETAHAMNLFDMDQKYADVISVNAAVEYLNGLKRRNAFERDGG